MRDAAFSSSDAATSRPAFDERIGDGQARAAAAGEAERAGFAAPLGDAVRERGGEQRARLAGGFSVVRDAHAPAILVGGLADAVQGAPIGVGVADVRSLRDGSRCRRRILVAQRVALLQQRGQVGGERGLFSCFGGQHHRRQPGMRRQSEPFRGRWR